ncbi:MAG: TIGR04283 family arsenosugar biosynthesis glycosyltransferase [Blastocatellia bacterium]
MTVVTSASPNRPAISIIIPSLNEEAQIAATLAALRPAVNDHGAEIIVVDGGSVDRTLEMARRFDFARVVEFNLANRGLQMNEGARASRGDTLLFLHADAVAPSGALGAINSALSNDRLLGGCFRIRFPKGAPLSLGAVAWGINWRTRLFRTATGDQAIFVRRRVFEEIGGYERIPLMEDIALFNQIKRRGKVTVLSERVEISPRRWLKHGVWRTVLLMYALRLGYWIGVSPATLKQFFLDVR